MMQIHEELLVFLNAVITGIIIRLFYQCIAKLREIQRHRLWMIGMEDFLFWILTAAYTFVQIYQTSSGVIRWYFILGVVVGSFFASKILVKIEIKIKKIGDLHKGKTVAKQNKRGYYNTIKGEKVRDSRQKGE